VTLLYTCTLTSILAALHNAVKLYLELFSDVDRAQFYAAIDAVRAADDVAL
jgi:hypothetical protein